MANLPAKTVTMTSKISLLYLVCVCQTAEASGAKTQSFLHKPDELAITDSIGLQSVKSRTLEDEIQDGLIREVQKDTPRIAEEEPIFILKAA